MNDRIQIWLTAQGRTGTPLVDYTLVDRSDGAGPHIDQWNTATLGPQPSPAQLAAITPAQIAAHAVVVRDTLTSRLADDPVARAVARVAWEELKKFEVRSNQTALTWDEFRDAIKAQIASRLGP